MIKMDFSSKEIFSRERRGEGCIKFGIKFLDDSLDGILPSDMILVGARSGAGKTQICCEILSSAVDNNKKVLYIALEAERLEIEGRLKFKVFMDLVFSDMSAKTDIDFGKWMLGKYIYTHTEQENEAIKICEKKYANAFVKYKHEKFDVNDLIETITASADEVDLIIVDHVHYFDFGDDSENKAIKDIAVMARTLALENNKPIILVAHLRKSDKRFKELAPDMDEFHGSSDLAKIATKIITLAPGKNMLNGGYETFIRIPKNRFGGGNPQLVGRVFFSKKGSGYESAYEVGWANQEEFEPLVGDAVPRWARQPGYGRVLHSNASNAARPYADS